MSNYPIHTIASAPENSKPGLEQLQQAFGVIPNIAAAIANSPKLINSLVGVFQQVHSSSSLSRRSSDTMERKSRLGALRPLSTKLK